MSKIKDEVKQRDGKSLLRGLLDSKSTINAVLNSSAPKVDKSNHSTDVAQNTTRNPGIDSLLNRR